MFPYPAVARLDGTWAAYRMGIFSRLLLSRSTYATRRTYKAHFYALFYNAVNVSA